MLRLIIIAILPFLFSFSFTPMTKTLNIDKADKTQFQIQNTSNKPIPVVLKVLSRIQKSDGSEKLPQTRDFQIIPPQVIVPPKDKRSIRLSYKGNKELDREASYRVVAEQVPLNVGEKKKSGIEMLLKYQAALYVAKDEFQSKLDINKFEVGQKLKVYIKNSGRAHQYLRNVQIAFLKDENKISVSKKDVESLEGQNILAGVERVFEFSVPKGLTQSYKALLKYD